MYNTYENFSYNTKDFTYLIIIVKILTLRDCFICKKKNYVVINILFKNIPDNPHSRWLGVKIVLN